MKLYHYTPAHNLSSIKEKGLLDFGVSWFTSSETIENTVNMLGRGLQGRVVINKTKDTRSFSEDRIEKYDLFSQFMILEMIDHISDTSKWYYSEKKIPSKDITAYEVEVDGKWIKYEKGMEDEINIRATRSK